jgi:hypothetical protein
VVFDVVFFEVFSEVVVFAADDVVFAVSAEVVVIVSVTFAGSLIGGGSSGLSLFARHMPKHTITMTQKLRARAERLMNIDFFLSFSFRYSSRR